MRVISESLTAAHDALMIELAGIVRAHYELPVWDPDQVVSIDGAKFGTIFVGFQKRRKRVSATMEDSGVAIGKHHDSRVFSNR